MSALICGSYAYDTIMVFNDQFKNHIIPDKVHMLNISFLVPEMRREFGGCAGNIAYNLNLLGGDPLPMATVGSDFGNYGEWLEECGINDQHIMIIADAYTGQAFITTDLDDNQITAFHPGAMSNSHDNSVFDAEDVTIGIVSPDGRDGMLQHAQEFAEANIPFIFDPGQGMPMFSGDELTTFMDQATWATLNDYEAQMMQEKTGQSLDSLAQSVEALIVTKGGDGSTIYTREDDIEIPSATPRMILDPTGCGDAYRAGLLYGLMNDMDWETTGRIASLMGAVKIEKAGTQNHNFSYAELEERFKFEFDRSI